MGYGLVPWRVTLQKPSILRIRTASLAAACHFAIWSLDGKHYDMSWWGVVFFFNLVFLGTDKNGWLSNNLWVSKDLGQAGVLKWNCILRDGLFGLPFFVWNLVGATDVLPWLLMYLGAFVCTPNFHRMNGLGLFLYTYQECRRVACTLFDSNWISTFLHMAGQFQSIVGISGANHCRGIFPIACLVIGVFWSWSFIP